MMNIPFDDGGFGPEHEEGDQPQEQEGFPQVQFDEEAWDDTEILQIFDEAVRSHVTKGEKQKSKDKKEKAEESSAKVRSLYIFAVF